MKTSLFFAKKQIKVRLFKDHDHHGLPGNLVRVARHAYNEIHQPNLVMNLSQVPTLLK